MPRDGSERKQVQARVKEAGLASSASGGGGVWDEEVIVVGWRGKPGGRTPIYDSLGTQLAWIGRHQQAGKPKRFPSANSIDVESLDDALLLNMTRIRRGDANSTYEVVATDPGAEELGRAIKGSWLWRRPWQLTIAGEQVAIIERSGTPMARRRANAIIATNGALRAVIHIQRGGWHVIEIEEPATDRVFRCLVLSAALLAESY